MSVHLWRTFLCVVWLSAAVGRVAAQPVAAGPPQFGAALLDSVVTIMLTTEDGPARAVGSGLIVRGDGLVLTAYHLVKGAGSIAVRLRNGETFDSAELVATDERRNVALLRVPAAGLYPLVSGAAEEALVGARVCLLTASGAGGRLGVLSAVSLADEIPGAGTGYRVLRFDTPLPTDALGGLIVDERGRALGVLTAQPQARVQNYAVPLSSLVGLVRSVGVRLVPPTPLAADVTAPVPIPQATVSVPQRPTLPLEARGPGSVVVHPVRPADVLLAAKTIYVTSNSVSFKPEQLVNELKKRPEFDAWSLTFVDDVRVADLILSIDHLVLTWKYTFTLTHQRTGVVVATGNRIIWDGNLGAPYMAARVIERLTQVRAQAAPQSPPAAPRSSVNP